MSERPNLFISLSDSESKSRFKNAKELAKLIRNAKRESYPGIPNLTEDYIIVEDEQGQCEVTTYGLDWLELSLLISNKAISLPGATRLQLARLGIFIPEKLTIN